MGVAFASSLLGLAGSLIVGLLELFAGHGQNRFYRELEEWLSSITRVGFTTGEDATAEQNIMAGVVDHMAEQMDALQQMFLQAENGRAEVNASLAGLAAAIDRMDRRPAGDDASAAALERVAAGQEKLISLIESRGQGDGMDAESRMRLRSIDVQMLRILEEISAGRQESMAELRLDINRLTDALAPRRPRPMGTTPPGDG
jgi:hypothetical protein